MTPVTPVQPQQPGCFRQQDSEEMAESMNQSACQLMTRLFVEQRGYNRAVKKYKGVKLLSGIFWKI